MEEFVIAQAHFIITIIKLRPSGTSILASYLRIQKHIVIFPQQPGLLLKLLLSSNF